MVLPAHLAAAPATLHPTPHLASTPAQHPHPFRLQVWVPVVALTSPPPAPHSPRPWFCFNPFSSGAPPPKALSSWGPPPLCSLSTLSPAHGDPITPWAPPSWELSQGLSTRWLRAQEVSAGGTKPALITRTPQAWPRAGVESCGPGSQAGTTWVPLPPGVSLA